MNFKDKKRVLVFPCGTEIGLEIHRALCFSAHIELFGASSIPDHARFVYKNYVEGIPFPSSDKFIDILNSTIKTEKIDLVIPAHDSVVLKLARNTDKILCKTMIPNPLACEIMMSKKKTYEIFQSLISTPKLYDPGKDALEFPLFLKPEYGQGAEGTCVVKSRKELNFYLKGKKNLLLMEYLPDEEYTIDCFTDRKGELIFVGGRERGRIIRGISVNTFPVDDSEFNKVATAINDRIKLRGPWFFQMKRRSNNELVLMEMAPRIAGGMGLYRNLGINLPLMGVYDAFDIDVDIIWGNYLRRNKWKFEMDRALINRFTLNINYSHVYIDLDSTIIISDYINTTLIAFLHQCFNKGIKVHLLSRHANDISETIKRYRIENMFDTVTHIKESTKENPSAKVKCIKHLNSIFIDDSFIERREVSKLGIPVFGIDATECLIDWRL